MTDQEQDDFDKAVAELLAKAQVLLAPETPASSALDNAVNAVGFVAHRAGAVAAQALVAQGKDGEAAWDAWGQGLGVALGHHVHEAGQGCCINHAAQAIARIGRCAMESIDAINAAEAVAPRSGDAPSEAIH